MNRRGLAVAPRAAAHLVELDLVERQVVEHHVPDVGDVDPFTERGGRDEDHEVVVAEQILDHLAFATRKARVVKADEARELGDAAAQHARQRDRLLARVHVDDGFSPAAIRFAR